MFSQFKKIVNSSLEELERLSDGVQEKQQREREQLRESQQQQQQQFPGLLSHGGRGYSESSLAHFQPASSSSTSSGGFPGLGPGRARSPNPGQQQRANEATYHRPASTQSAVAATPGHLGPSVPLAMPMTSPVTASGSLDGNSYSNSLTGASRGTSDGFPSFGLGGLQRSRSGLQRASLDLSSLRNSNSLEFGGGPLTPSRDGREMPEWLGGGGRPAAPSTPLTTPRIRRRMSGRAQSMSGPFTPNTMQKMDPFFFVALQGLPDELKIAAFTPLPKEDADEELDQIDQELNPTFHSLPITLPKLDTSGLLSRSVPPSFRPSSAPAAGPAQSFGQAQLARSPLIEQTRASLLSLALHDHDEVEEEEHHDPSPFSHTPEMPSQQVFPSQAQEPAVPPEPSIPQTAASPMPAFDDLPDVFQDGPKVKGTQKQDVGENAQPVPFGRLSASSTPIRGRSPSPAGRSAVAPPVVIEPLESPLPQIAETASTPAITANAAQSESTQAQAASVPSTTPTVLAPAPAPKTHESLQARLARISRAASPVPQTSSSTASAAPISVHSTLPSREATPIASTSISDTKQQDMAKEASVTAAVADVASTHDASAIEKLLRQYTPITSLANLATLEEYLKSQSASAAAWKADAEAAKALQASDKQLRARVAALEAEVKEVQSAVLRAETKAKDEEEKKAKSITLLKAVRQKSIKAEKDREEAEVMRDALRASEENLTIEIKSSRQRFEQEILGLRTAQEGQISRLRGSYEREAQSIRATYEREAAARRGQTDMDILNLRQGYAREMSVRDGRIAILEANLRDLKREKDTLFETLQSRQAEVESAVANQDRVQVAYDELQYEMKESGDKVIALQEEVASFKKARLDQTRDEGHTRRLLSELESSNADKIRVFEDRVKQLERDRSDSEESMARKLQEKLREVERMRRDIERRDTENGEETQRREERQHRMDRAEGMNRSLQEKVNALEMLLNEAKLDNSRVKEDEATANELLADQNRRTAELEARLDELSSKEIQLRANNKTLREELRKVQSGVLLSERSRNPGVGYFSNFANNNSNASPSNLGAGGDGMRSPALFSPTMLGSQSMASRASSVNGSIAPEDEKEAHQPPTNSATSAATNGNSNNEEEALNFEYVRNVILQFLEHKEMRPHLVSVLGVILHFTPGETRRLAAKASA